MKLHLIIFVLLFFCQSAYGENTIFAKTKECNGILKKVDKFVGKEQWIKAREALGDLEVSGEICQNDYQRALYWHNAVYILDKLSDTSGVILAYKKLVDTPDVDKNLRNTAHRYLANEYLRQEAYQNAIENYELYNAWVDTASIQDLQVHEWLNAEIENDVRGLEIVSWLYGQTENDARGLDIIKKLFKELKSKGIQPTEDHFKWKILFQLSMSDISVNEIFATIDELIINHPSPENIQYQKQTMERLGKYLK
jgi:tetratricopeptide (TPR) repeat protein